MARAPKAGPRYTAAVSDSAQDVPRDEAIEAAGYELVRRVASGGMGEIWKARAIASGQPVAIKRILSVGAGATLSKLADRMLREAATTAKIDHPNVIRYLGTGRDQNGSPFIVLEWLDGKTLSDLMELELDLEEALDLVRQGLDGLAACHDAGVVHRDIKPDNFFVVQEDERRVVKLLDLGIALEESRNTRMTEAGAILGTLHYLAPEQAQGSLHVDHRADIYAMGVMLYQLCTGKLPFEASAPIAVLIKITTETPERPKKLQPDLPDWLDALIWRALQKAPSDRFDSAHAMRLALSEVSLGRRHSQLSPRPAMIAPDLVDAATINEGNLLDPRRSGEFRVVTLLFVEVGDEHALVRDAHRAIAEAEGVVQNLAGDYLLGLFGVERTRGDEALRAVLAGLEVARAADRPTRILASTIRVEVGEGLRLASEELERAIASLDRLPRGEVVLDPATQALARSRIRTRELDAHIVAEDATRRSVQPAAPARAPMVGRDEPLARLSASLSGAVEDGECRVALVLGPSGIGKTRLVREFVAGLDEREADERPLVLSATVDPGVAGLPGGAVASTIRRAAGVSVGRGDASRHALMSFIDEQGADLGEAGTQFLAFALGLGETGNETTALQAALSDPRLMKERLTEAFVSLLGSLSARRPLVLWLDDMQWEREAARELLSQVLERLDDSPIFVLVTAHPELLDEHPSLFSELEPSRIDLEPLRKRSCKKLSAALLDGKVGKELEAGIREWSHGNPYLVEEFVAWLRSHDAITKADGEWKYVRAPEELGLPVALEAAVQGRMDQLESDLKELLKVASVLGNAAWSEAIASMWADGPSARMEELVAADFLELSADSRFAGSLEWSFRSRAVRNVAYQMLPPARQKFLHSNAARWLEVQLDVDAKMVAHHFERAGEESRAKDWYAKAGAHALRSFDSHEAVECFKKSLGEEVGELDRIARTAELAAALVLTAEFEEAFGLCKRLLDEDLVSGNKKQRARILWLQGRTLRGLNRLPESVSVLREAEGLLKEMPLSELHLDVDWALFWGLWSIAERQAARAVAERMRRSASELDRPDRVSEAALAGASIHAVDGDLSVAVELAKQATQLAREVGHVLREIDALLLLGVVLTITGMFEDAEAALADAAALAARLRAKYSRYSVAEYQGYLALQRENTAEAIAAYQRAVGFAQELGGAAALASARAGLVRARLRDGPEHEDALALLHMANDALAMIGESGDATELKVRLAGTEACLQAGKHDEAWVQAQRLAELLEQIGGEEYEVEAWLAIADAADNVGQVGDDYRLRAKERVDQYLHRLSATEHRNRLLRVAQTQRSLSIAPRS